MFLPNQNNFLLFQTILFYRLYGFLYHDEASLSTWDPAFDKHKITGSINSYYLKMLYGHTYAAELTRHLLAFEYFSAAAGHTSTEGCCLTMVLGAVGFRSTLVVMTFDRAGETFAAAGANNVDNLAFCEDISSQSLAYCVRRLFSESIFTQIFNWVDTSFFKLTLYRFCQMFFFDSAVAELYCVVSVGFNSFNSCYHVWQNFNNAYRNQVAVFSEYLRHS